MQPYRTSTANPRQVKARLWRYRITFAHRTLSHALPVPSLQALWVELERLCPHHGLEPDLVVAVVLVESALSAGTVDPIRFFPAPVVHQFLVDDLEATTLTPDFAVRHLAEQLERFLLLPRALVAYHAGPARVADHGDGLFTDPHGQAYVEAVLATRDWLGETRPWDAWKKARPLRSNPSPERLVRRQPVKPATPQGRLVRLLCRLDELKPTGYFNDHPMNGRAALLKAALPSGWSCLYELIERQSDTDRHMLHLLNIDRLPRKQAAHAMGISPAALRNRLWRLARRILKGGFVL